MSDDKGRSAALEGAIDVLWMLFAFRGFESFRIPKRDPEVT